MCRIPISTGSRSTTSGRRRSERVPFPARLCVHAAGLPVVCQRTWPGRSQEPRLVMEKWLSPAPRSAVFAHALFPLRPAHVHVVAQKPLYAFWRNAVDPLCIARPQQQQPAEGKFRLDPGCGDVRPSPKPGAGPASLPRLAVYPWRDERNHRLDFKGGDFCCVAEIPSPTKSNT